MTCIYLYRRWEESTADFKSALRLKSQIPSAHVNLGLIQMNMMDNTLS